MAHHLKVFFISFFIFIISDAIWFKCIASHFYFEQYGSLLRVVDGKLVLVWWAALMVYVLFGLGMIVFVLPLSQNAIRYAAAYGALFGCIAYGVYNFTCIAVLKDFPIPSALIDILWGSFVFAWAASITQALISYFKI